MGTSRTELFRALGLTSAIQPGTPRIDKRVEAAYEAFEDEDFAKTVKMPHGRPWNWSFHASSFPGGEDEKYCGRKAVYQLMNIPGEKFSPRSRAVMEQGRAAERQITYRLGRAGLTLSGACSLDPDVDGKQLHLEDRVHWLTGSPDLMMDLRDDGWDKVTPVDVKSKDMRGLVKLRIGEVQPPRNYVAQVMAYGYLSRLVHRDMGWEDMGLKPPDGGLIYFVSRENPRETHEHWVPYDHAYVAVGLSRLREWIGLFRSGKLEERPKSWRWTEEPCKWCEFKKPCKRDIRADVTEVLKSCTIQLARDRDPGYDPEAVVHEVNDAWREVV